MLKKVFYLFLIICLVFSLCACSPKISDTLKKDSDEISGLVKLTRYTDEKKAPENEYEFDVPENYLPISNSVFAEVDSNNEIVAYYKAVKDEITGNYSFKKCDIEGNLLEVDENISKGLNSLLFKEPNVTIEVNESKSLVLVTDPIDFNIISVIWETSDANVATVENGVIVGKTVGTAQIIAHIGEISTICSVTVTNNEVSNPSEPSESSKPPEPSSPSKPPKPVVENIAANGISVSKKTVSIYVGTKTTISATVYPSNATNKSVKWSSSNTSVATISGGEITAIGVGTAIITAKNSNGNTDTCKVTVSKKPAPTITTNKITLNQTTANMFVGDKLTLTATVYPSNATNKTIIWSTSNGSATVSNGVVTAKSKGSVKITAKASGGQIAECTITITEKFKWEKISQKDCPTSVSAEFDKYILNAGEKFLAVKDGDYTYVLIKGIQGQKISVVSVEEKDGKINIKYTYSGASNCVFLKINRINKIINYIR